MALSNIFNVLDLVINLFDKLAFVLTCFFLGNLAFKGWKGFKNVIFKWVSVVILGLICFFGGLIIQDFLNWNFFASDYICSILVAVILYVITWLISNGFKSKSKYATKESFQSLAEDVKELKIQVAKLTKALKEENITPEPLTKRMVKNCLKKEFGEGVKVKSLEKDKDVWKAVIKMKKGEREVLIDAYNGEVAEEKEVKSVFSFVTEHRLSVLGMVLLLGFLIFLGSNVSLKTVNAFNQAFDFSFLFEEPLPSGCYETSVLLENFEESNTTSAEANMSIIADRVSSELPEYHLLPSLTKGVDYDGEDFYLVTSYSEEVDSLGNVITVSDWENVYNVRVCSLKEDYTLCECIGGSKTDPVFTVPYLIQLGLIEEAVQNIIMNSLTGLIPV